MVELNMVELNMTPQEVGMNVLQSATDTVGITYLLTPRENKLDATILGLCEVLLPATMKGLKGSELTNSPVDELEGPQRFSMDLLVLGISGLAVACGEPGTALMVKGTYNFNVNLIGNLKQYQLGWF